MSTSTATAPAGELRWVRASEAAEIIGCPIDKVSVLARAGKIRKHRRPLSYPVYWRPDVKALALPEAPDGPAPPRTAK